MKFHGEFLVKEMVPFLVLLENFLCQHLHVRCLLFMYVKADLVYVRVTRESHRQVLRVGCLFLLDAAPGPPPPSGRSTVSGTLCADLTTAVLSVLVRTFLRLEPRRTGSRARRNLRDRLDTVDPQ